MSDIDDLQAKWKQVQETSTLAASMSYDTYKQLINVRAVAANGKLGALSAADTLSGAPVGDAGQVRSSIGLGALATAEALSDAPTGDAAKLRSDIGAVTKDELNLGSIATKDALGWASYEAATTTNTMGRMATGVYRYTPESTPPKEDRVAKYGTMLVLQDDYPDWRSKLYFPAGSGRIFYLHYAGGSSQPWKPLGEIMMTGINCTVDANGFLKFASPIFRVGAPVDVSADQNFKVSGHGAANSEAAGVTCQHEREGVYKVTGALGFADDGVWTIETPKDENGQALLWVNTIQHADGMITIETYHRTHPDAPPFARNKIDGKNDGDPLDIPQSRWIDLRLKMPDTTDA